MADPNDELAQEALDDEPKNILFALIKQLKIGMDLHRITFPTFVLEPRSMLERITDFMSYQDLALAIPKEPSPVMRFLGVVRYFLSGWNIRPKGVKKPYNPVMGEYFRCKWHLPDGSISYYLAEQVSHHPPVSAYFFVNPTHRVMIQGHLAPRSKFLGNSAASIMGGRSHLTFLDLPDETYIITMPNMYAVGLFVGTLTMELADSCTVTCQKNDLIAEIDFKFKPMIGGSHNNLVGKIKQSGTVISNISGKWTEVMWYTDIDKKGGKEVLFDTSKATKAPTRITPPESEQGEYESRRLWAKVTAAILKRDQDAATDEKSAIENHQRKLRAIREEQKIEFVPRFFQPTPDKLDWVPKVDIAKMTNEDMEKYIFHEVDHLAATLNNLTLGDSTSPQASASVSREFTTGSDDLDVPTGEED